MPPTDIDVDLGDVLDTTDSAADSADGGMEDIDFDGLGDLMGGGGPRSPSQLAAPLAGLFEDVDQHGPTGLLAPSGAEDHDAAFLGTGAHALSARLRNLAARLRAAGQTADAEAVTEALAMITVFSPGAT